MCTYIMLQVASYYAFMLIVSAGSVALSSFTGNLWSKPIYTMASYDPIAMAKYGLRASGDKLITKLYASNGGYSQFLSGGIV